jgi:curved DNA-binding protein CbpA
MNPFASLGVPNNCSIETAKAAYRKLAQQHHPDKGGAAETFKEISTAWDKIDNGFKVKEEKLDFESYFSSTKP